MFVVIDSTYDNSINFMVNYISIVYIFMNSRFEFTFSYWIFAWFLCYYAGLVPYIPNIWLIIATFYDLWLLLCMLYYNYKWIYIVLYILVLFILKLIPLWLLRFESYAWRDFIAGVVLFVIYVGWVFFRLGSVVKMVRYYRGVRESIRNGKPFSPWISLLYSSESFMD